MERYCSCVSKLIGFKTPHKKGFLVFGVPNAKYLAFSTPDGDAIVTIVVNIVRYTICTVRYVSYHIHKILYHKGASEVVINHMIYTSHTIRILLCTKKLCIVRVYQKCS